jgi:hypothetical protein
MADTATYFGLPGNLRKLYDPVGGMLATRELETSVFKTGAGGARVSKALDGTRQYMLNYEALGRDNFEYLNAFQLGHMGPGPFVLLDPGRRNLLMPNQSSATSVRNDTLGFTVAGAGGSISSDSTLVAVVPRTLKWSFATTTPVSASLLLDKPWSGWQGIPVINRPYVFSCVLFGAAGAITVALTLKWMDLAGATLATTTGATVVSSTTAWTPVFVTASPPAGSVWVQPGVAPTVATITSGEALYLSALQLAEGSAPGIWQPGTGVWPVQLVGLPERYGFAEPGMLVQPVLALQEVR